MLKGRYFLVYDDDHHYTSGQRNVNAGSPSASSSSSATSKTVENGDLFIELLDGMSGSFSEGKDIINVVDGHCVAGIRETIGRERKNAAEGLEEAGRRSLPRFIDFKGR